jgi:hypothetical protein
VGFFTESGDGTEIVTANNKILPGTPSSKANNRIALWLPEKQFADDLYEYHQRLIRHFAILPKQDILNGQPLEYMKKYADNEVAYWVQEGYYKLEASSEKYRLTWKGATLTAWKQLWPIKPIRRACRKYQTHKLLRKLEE